MAQNSSFDITTDLDLQEVDNAVNQATKEIQQRYDFKGTKCTIELDRKEGALKLDADDDFRLKQVVQVLREKLAKRGVPLKNLEILQPGAAPKEAPEEDASEAEQWGEGIDLDVLHL